MKNIHIIPAGGDNYCYVISFEGNALIIDPSGAPVQSFMSERNLFLKMVCMTHHHADHIAGLDQLCTAYSPQVISADPKRIPQTNTTYTDGEVFHFGWYTITILCTPGHTKTSVCYYVASGASQEKALFTGDTLFICGCGRLFEGSAEEMWRSFVKIRQCDKMTKIFPGHEYTLENFAFAQYIA